jgi:predicted ATP-grasp superfamily ATP-dependent carboligase
VVVPATTVPSTVACLRSLGSAGVHTVVAADGEIAPARYSVYCDEVVDVPDPDSDLLAYRDALLDLATRRDVRTIIPVRETDVYVLSRYRAAFDPHVSLPVPPLETLRQVHDRRALVAAAESAGVPVPETELLSAVDDWSSPKLVKSRYNLLTSSYHAGLSPAETRSTGHIVHVSPDAPPDVNRLREKMGHDPIVQRYVPADEEYMVGALYDDGDPLVVFQHRQVRGTRYTGSGGAYRESVDIPALEAVATDLLDHLEWHGVACLEYLRDRHTGEFVLAEINPRMWQSLSATVAMGADFPRYYWQLATDRAGAVDPDYDVGVGCHWLKGEFLHALSLARYDSPLADRPGYLDTLGDIVASCRAHPRFDYLRADDPGPFVADWLSLLGDRPGLEQICAAIGDLRDRDDRGDADQLDPDSGERPLVTPDD